MVKTFLTVFGTIFLAELGDKTQLATFFYAADSGNSKLLVFLASAAALAASSALAVFLGSFATKLLDPRHLSWAAGCAFIAIGIWTIIRA